MSTPPSLPSVPGLGWSRHKKPGFSTRIASHVSGREVRVALMEYPLYEFEAVYSGLPSSNLYPGPLGSTDLQTLMGFFLQLQGQFGTFLYADPDDNAVTNQAFATGDGHTTAFTMMRSLGSFLEPVGWVTGITSVSVNGSVVSVSTYSLTTPNTITFTSAPGNSYIIAATFTYAFNCRFLDDQMDFEEFMSNLWKLDSMKFRSVKP